MMFAKCCAWKSFSDELERIKGVLLERCSEMKYNKGDEIMLFSPFTRKNESIAEIESQIRDI